MKPTFLGTKNHHPHDDRISFDEPTHIYTIDGDSSFTSVTTFLHQHFPHFDAPKVIADLLAIKRTYKGRSYINKNEHRKKAIANIQKKLEERNENADIEIATALLNDTSSQEYKDEVTAIAATWEETSTSGTQTHSDIEYFYNKENVKNDTQEFKYFLKFNEDFEREHPNYRPYRTEWTVFDKELKLAGSVDMIYENIEDGSLMIYDWKRVKDIKYDAYEDKTAISPHLEGIPNANFWHYSVQLNTYKALIEKNYNKKVTKLVLVRLYPDAPSYEIHECADLQKEVKALLEERHKKIKAL